MLLGLMRRPPPTSARALLLLVALVVGAGACRNGPATASTATTTSAPTTTTIDRALAPLLLREEDLPAGFGPSDNVDDTITAFCASEDAAGGLRATARAVRGFTLRGGGASVLQLTFRFSDDGAARFVSQAAEVLGRCSGVPDIKGLAFDYDALSPDLQTMIDASPEPVVGRHGVNVGSGTLSINIAVLQHGDVGQLVAVLGLDQPRAELDTIAAAAFSAVLAKAER